MLETISGNENRWEAISFLMLGASVCGSNAYKESEGSSLGNSTSRNSPGQTVVHMGGEDSTMALRAAELTVTVCRDP